VYLRHLRAKVFFYSLIRFVLQDKIFAELRDFLLQWYGLHGYSAPRLTARWSDCRKRRKAAQSTENVEEQAK
jgi:hypothetical protein